MVANHANASPFHIQNVHLAMWEQIVFNFKNKSKYKSTSNNRLMFVFNQFYEAF